MAKENETEDDCEVGRRDFIDRAIAAEYSLYVALLVIVIVSVVKWWLS